MNDKAEKMEGEAGPVSIKSEVTWQSTSVSREMRAALQQQSPKCIWFTGLSGSGKSTLANALELELHKRGFKTMLLDGDNVRHGLCRDLGMTDEDRTENIRRVAEVARLMVEAGLIVVTAFISPFNRDREAARKLFAPGDFIEVFVDTSLATCEQRDPKGLYQKARKGVIKDFTGVDSPYERPESPELVLCTDKHNVASCVGFLLAALAVS